MKQYKLVKEWNADLAQDHYVLYLLREAIAMTLDVAREDGFVYDVISSGDMQWAQRTARHFNLDVPS